ncbi:glycosyltransferase [Nocardioides sambongensis]|uniref:glycosyltransferase n=1 Tax=Nocardioides sambongensis TaxID=2589074 RepID=UPI00112805CA|nr:glycosyltransferase [Nocardioides sambongensis]
MRAVFALVGSRGDVQPGLVAAQALTRRGHDVRVGVAPNLVDAAAGLGLPVTPLGVDSRALLASDLVRREMRSADPRRRLRALRSVAVHGWSELRDGLLPLAADADLVVTGLLGQEVGAAVAERLACGFAALHYAPVRANDVVRLLPGPGGPRVTQASWRLGERVRWGLTRAGENEQRAALGLPPAVVDLPQRMRERGALEIQAYDPLLVDPLPERWGARRPFVGYLRPAGASGTEGTDLGDPDPELDAALERGAVHVGFGSMPVPDPAGLVALLDRVAAELDTTIVWGAGWSELPAATGERVLVRRELDHAAVLPRCRASVHHGGAGTVGAALQAGVGQVVCWWSADQPMWARRIESAGIGCGMPFARLDAARLTRALRIASGGQVADRARGLARRSISPRDAARGAAEALERAC